MIKPSKRSSWRCCICQHSALFRFHACYWRLTLRSWALRQKRFQWFKTVTTVYLIKAKMPPGWLHSQTLSSKTSGGVTLEEFWPGLDQNSEVTRGQRRKPRGRGVSAGFPNLQTPRLSVCHVPLRRMSGTERERNVSALKPQGHKSKRRDDVNRAASPGGLAHCPQQGARAVPLGDRRLPGAPERRWRGARQGALTSPCVSVGPAWAGGFGSAGTSRPGLSSVAAASPASAEAARQPRCFRVCCAGTAVSAALPGPGGAGPRGPISPKRRPGEVAGLGARAGGRGSPGALCILLSTLAEALI